MLTIARFNWPYYLCAVVVLVGAVAGLIFLHPIEWRALSWVAFAGSAYFLAGSLGVAHLVYDRSELYRWSWLNRALQGAKVGEGILCHAGFDDASVGLRKGFGCVQWRVLDHFDEERMTEPSIHRARALLPPTADTLSAPYDRWPIKEESADLVIGFLAIHELRTEAERSAWFNEAKRCLRREGRVVVVEHLRDVANFLAFGPGFLHFHSQASWQRCWESAGLSWVDEFRVTPFVRVFVVMTP